MKITTDLNALSVFLCNTDTIFPVLEIQTRFIDKDNELAANTFVQEEIYAGLEQKGPRDGPDYNLITRLGGLS